MPYVVSRKNRSWELRESELTDRGPRSHTLAGFRTLTPEVVERAVLRSRSGLTREGARRAATKAGAPIAGDPVDEMSATLLGEMAAGRRPRSALRRLLADALGFDGDPPTDAERTAATWVGASLQSRGEALMDLLLLADRIPARGVRASSSAFPRIRSTRASSQSGPV